MQTPRMSGRVRRLSERKLRDFGEAFVAAIAKHATVPTG